MYSFPMGLVPFLLVLLSVAPVFANDSLSRFDQIAKQADAARADDRMADAERLYQQGLRLRPAWKEGWWSLGSLLYDQDRFPEAEVAFRRVAAITPHPGPAYAFLGLCEYESRKYSLAVQHFRDWARIGWAGTPQLIDVGVFHFALLLTREGKFVEALYMLSTEVAKSGDSPALSEAMGLASLRVPKLPEEYSPQDRELVWLSGEAAAHAAQSPPDFAQADEYAKRLLIRYSDQPNVHYFVATLFTFENKSAEAGHEFREELRVSPQHVAAMLGVATIDLDNDDLGEAQALAEHAVELEPTSAEAHHALGRILLAAGHLEQSIRELEAAKQLAPRAALVRSHLAMAYSRAGRLDQAKAEARAFTSLAKTEQVLAPPGEKKSQQRRSK